MGNILEDYGKHKEGLKDCAGSYKRNISKSDKRNDNNHDDNYDHNDVSAITKWLQKK